MLTRSWGLGNGRSSSGSGLSLDLGGGSGSLGGDGSSSWSGLRGGGFFRVRSMITSRRGGRGVTPFTPHLYKPDSTAFRIERTSRSCSRCWGLFLLGCLWSSRRSGSSYSSGSIRSSGRFRGGGSLGGLGLGLGFFDLGVCGLGLLSLGCFRLGLGRLVFRGLGVLRLGIGGLGLGRLFKLLGEGGLELGLQVVKSVESWIGTVSSWNLLLRRQRYRLTNTRHLGGRM